MCVLHKVLQLCRSWMKRVWGSGHDPSLCVPADAATELQVSNSRLADVEAAFTAQRSEVSPFVDGAAGSGSPTWGICWSHEIISVLLKTCTVMDSNTSSSVQFLLNSCCWCAQRFAVLHSWNHFNSFGLKCLLTTEELWFMHCVCESFHKWVMWSGEPRPPVQGFGLAFSVLLVNRLHFFFNYVSVTLLKRDTSESK